MKPFAKIYAVMAIGLMTLALNGCGEHVIPGEGELEFVPSDVSITTSFSAVRTQTIAINMKDSEGNLVQNVPVAINMYLHGRLPFAGAVSTVDFIDEDEVPITIPAPEVSANQGTFIVLEANQNGFVEFNIQYPVGGDYVIQIDAISVGVRAERSFELTVELEEAAE